MDLYGGVTVPNDPTIPAGTPNLTIRSLVFQSSLVLTINNGWLKVLHATGGRDSVLQAGSEIKGSGDFGVEANADQKLIVQGVGVIVENSNFYATGTINLDTGIGLLSNHTYFGRRLNGTTTTTTVTYASPIGIIATETWSDIWLEGSGSLFDIAIGNRPENFILGGGWFNNYAKVKRSRADTSARTFDMYFRNLGEEAILELSGGAKMRLSETAGSGDDPNLSFLQEAGKLDLSGSATQLLAEGNMLFTAGEMITRDSTLGATSIAAQGTTTWKIDGSTDTFYTTLIKANLKLDGSATLVMDGKGNQSGVSDQIKLDWESGSYTFTMPATNSVKLEWSTQGAVVAGTYWNLVEATAIDATVAALFARERPEGYSFDIIGYLSPPRIWLTREGSPRG